MLTVSIDFFDIEELQGTNRICCEASKRWIANTFGTTAIHLKQVHDTLMSGDMPSDVDYGDDSGVAAWQKGSLLYANSLTALKAASNSIFATNEFRVVFEGKRHYFNSFKDAKAKQDEIVGKYISEITPSIYLYTEEVDSHGNNLKHIHVYDSSLNSIYNGDYKFMIKYPDESSYTEFDTVEQMQDYIANKTSEYKTGLSSSIGVITQRISCPGDDFFNVWVRACDMDSVLAD